MDPDARTFSVTTFNGLAQVLLQVNGTDASLTVSGEGLAKKECYDARKEARIDSLRRKKFSSPQEQYAIYDALLTSTPATSTTRPPSTPTACWT